MLLALDQQLNAAGKDPLPFLKKIQQAHPGDFWANRCLGGLLVHLGKSKEAIRYFQAALAIRPGTAVSHNNLGLALGEAGRFEEAVDQYKLALRIDPTLPLAHSRLALTLSVLRRHDEAIEQNRLALRFFPESAMHHAALGKSLESVGRHAEAVRPYRKAVMLDPKLTKVQTALRANLIRLGRVDEALAAWGVALAANPPEHHAWYGYAEFCLFFGREEDYRRARQALLAAFGGTSDPYVAERTSRACLLQPAPADELRQAAALAERAAAVDRSKYQGAYSFFVFVKGLAEYRQGRFDRAIAAMRGDASGVLGPTPRLVLAMALHQNGQAAEARKTLAAAVLAHDWRITQVRDQDGMIFHILRREAERMILPDLPAFLRGKHQPRDNDERFALLGICQFTNRTRALARLYADAFAAAPDVAEDLSSGQRDKAACAAAQAGCGRGADAAALDEAERTRWRKQAREWLKADLAAWARKIDSGAAADRALVQEKLTAWRADPDLSGLRQPGALDRVSVEERKEWLALWKGIDDLLARANHPPRPR